MEKSLLDHIETMKEPLHDEQAMTFWKVNELKAYPIISMSINTSIQSLVRSACSAWEAWQILREFYLRPNIHNRVRKKARIA